MPGSTTQGKLMVIRPDIKLFYFGFDALINTSIVFLSLFLFRWLFDSKKILANEIAVIRSWFFPYCQNMAKAIRNMNHPATKTGFEAGCMNIEEPVELATLAAGIILFRCRFPKTTEVRRYRLRQPDGFKETV